VGELRSGGSAQRQPAPHIAETCHQRLDIGVTAQGGMTTGLLVNFILNPQPLSHHRKTRKNALFGKILCSLDSGS
jgi:hypothetical protein